MAARDAILFFLAIIAVFILYIFVAPKIVSTFKSAEKINPLEIDFTSANGCVIIVNLSPLELNLEDFKVVTEDGDEYSFGKGVLRPFGYSMVCMEVGKKFKIRYKNKLIGMGVTT